YELIFLQFGAVKQSPPGKHPGSGGFMRTRSRNSAFMFWSNTACCAAALAFVPYFAGGRVQAQPPKELVIVNSASGGAAVAPDSIASAFRSEEHTSELQSRV